MGKNFYPMGGAVHGTTGYDMAAIVSDDSTHLYRYQLAFGETSVPDRLPIRSENSSVSGHPDPLFLGQVSVPVCPLCRISKRLCHYRQVEFTVHSNIYTY
jgi:hypothetical protein